MSPLSKKQTPDELPEIVETFSPSANKYARQAAKARAVLSDKADEAFEDQAWLLMYRLRPARITTARDPRILVRPNVPSPDIVVLFETWAAIVECKYSDSEAFQLRGLHSLRDAQDALKGPFSKRYGVSRLVLFLAVRDRQKVTKMVLREAQERHVALLDEREIRYFLNLQKQTGIGMGPMFWGRTFPSLISNDKLEVRALQLKVGKHLAYLFSANAHDLLVRAVVSHREIDTDFGEHDQYPGYQRMLKKSRLAKIAKHIRTYKTFPTPIVVAWEKSQFDLASVKDETEKTRFGTLHLPRGAASIQVIDGQHRLFGYTRVTPDPAHVIHVIGYKTPMAMDPAEMFVDINSEQKPVPKNLLWELYPDIYDEDDSNYYKRIVSEVVEALISRAPLQGLVTHIGTGRKGPITFQSLCSEIVGDLISKDGGLVAQIVGNDPGRKKAVLLSWMDSLFTVTKELGDACPDVNSYFIYSNVGVIPLVRVYSRILTYESAREGNDWLRSPKKIRETLKLYLAPVYRLYGTKTSAELSIKRRQRVGESGFNATNDEMTDIIQLNYQPDFPRRQQLSDIARDAHDIALEIMQINRKGMSSGKTKSTVFPSFDPYLFKKTFNVSEINSDTFRSIITVLYTELVEGGGGKKAEEGSRLAKLLDLKAIVENEAIQTLDNLRNYCDHALRVLNPDKKQDVIASLKKLSGRAELASLDELSSDDFEKVLRGLLERLRNDVLEPAIKRLS
jgi:DGQHR domain-containing protein